MIHFRILGGVELLDAGGAELRAVLTQPKRLALLAYLASETREFHSRETLLGLFWPELDEAHARAALSQAVYYLRQAIGAEVITNRGSEEIGVDPERLWCDVAEFDRALRRGDAVEALELYRGDLLSGLFLSDTPEWEQWLESERTRLRSQAAEAAWTLAEVAEAEGRGTEAARWGHRALALAGDEETHLRRLICLLERVGDRAEAVRAYEEFARRLARDYELEVSPETRDLIAQVRSPDEPMGTAGSVRASTAGAQQAMPSGSPAIGQGFQREDRASRRGPLLVGGVVGIAALAIGLSVLWPRTEDRPISPVPPDGVASRHRLAVLPLAYFGPDSEDEYLADGMTEELISRLSKLSGLRVIARTSVMPLRDTDKTVAELGRELDVDYVVEGSVRRSDERVRVAVQLIDARTEEHLWAEDFEAELEDVLDLQRQIAEQVVTRLPVRPGGVERNRLADRGTDDPEAHLLYLRGRFALAKDDSASFTRARGYFERAIERDPTYAQAWSGLSDAYDRLIWARALPSSETYPRARAAAERALELDPGLAAAHASLGRLLTTYYWDSPTAERHFRRAMELDPSNADAHRAYAAHLRNQGRLEEARAHAEMALELDPLAFFPHFEMMLLSFFERRYDDAIEQAQGLARMGPGYPMVHFILAKVRIQKRLFDEALKDLDRADPSGTFAPAIATRGAIQALTGRRADARKTLGDLATRFPEAHVAMDRAVVHIALGEKDRALDLIDQAIEERDWRVRLLKGEPVFDPLRSEPRFGELLARAGFTE